MYVCTNVCMHAYVERGGLQVAIRVTIGTYELFMSTDTTIGV